MRCHHLFLVYLVSAINAFQSLQSYTTTRQHIILKQPVNSIIDHTGSILKINDRNEHLTTSTPTQLNGKLWKRLHIEEDDPSDGPSWYLINCVAGVELDLLNQCRYVCEQENFPKTIVEKFVVPTERHLRSHGDKKKVVDVKVRYPGYVFCKIVLVEDVYEVLQNLDLARSWMGTVNRKGHKKLPPAPLPLGPEEVAKFKGLEEEQEVFEDMFGGDYTGRADTGADLLEQYSGYDVGQMVKVLRGNFEGEDGTVRRLKGGQLMVRMFTYGQTYDEWFDPDAIRPLSDLEVMRGLSGPTVPINQDQFDVSIGKKDASELEGPMDGTGGGEGSGALRSNLMQDAGIAPGRNRREDRVGARDMLGRSADEIKREEENWLAYREEKRASQRVIGNSELNDMPEATEAQKLKAMGPKKGRDTWGIVARSSWDGGEYGFEADSEQEERRRKHRTEQVYSDRPQGRGGRGGGRGRGGRDSSFDQRRDTRGRERNDERDERRSMQPRREENDWITSSSKAAATDDSSGEEDDFFNSLMSELSDDLSNDDKKQERSKGDRHHDNAGPNTRGAAVADRSSKEASDAEDSFFQNLMSELGGALDDKPASSSQDKGDADFDDDDFFSSLEAELSQSLGGDEKKEDDDDEDDFFASLQQEMGKALAEEDSPSETEDDVSDDFFSSLMNDVASDLELESTEDKAAIDSSHASSESHDSAPSPGSLASMKVPELKELLRSKGLKVGGKKQELIDRLTNVN